MPANTNKLSKFWQEFRRRRVLHEFTVYASASFVIIEIPLMNVDPVFESIQTDPRFSALLKKMNL
jgi:hypothetical protein